MLASHNWLMELSGLDLAPSDVARRLTAAGLEVESVRAWGEDPGGVVVAQVRALRPHPAREHLRLVTVWDGEREQEVVCGAANVPAAGGLVALARLGATLPSGTRIEERKLGGVVSRGMICSERELGLGAEEGGILVLEGGPTVVPGAELAEALSLRDAVYEIGLTPNRPDCLGHLGIARELCALLGEPFSPPVAPALQLGAAADGIRISLTAADRCPRYGAALVHGVRIAPSGFATRYRLHKLGLRAISNVVDATNLILLGFGHPIHAFDLAKLRGGRVDVRLSRAGETMHTLDGEARALGEDDLLICDGERPVALAGVMGGQGSEIGSATTDVLIECAYFDPRGIRRTSKRLGLHTDSSHRFERGVDPDAVPMVLAHAADLIARCAEGRAQRQGVDAYPSPVPRARTPFRPSRAAALLGIEVDAGVAATLFARLGCVSTPGALGLEVVLPSFRPDLKREVDLIEEYARLRGYDAIPTAAPRLLPRSEGTSREVGLVRRLREVAATLGLTEAVNFAFVAPADLERARVPTDTPRIANPMSEERAVLRSSVLPGLLSNLRAAQRHEQRRFAGYELSRVFRLRGAGALPDERYELGILLWGVRASWYEEREVLGFYDAKGIVQSLAHELLRASIQTVADDTLEVRAAFLHPRRRACVRIADREIGVLGELHPDVARELELDGRPIYASLDVAALVACAEASGARRARPLPKFPSATRDLAVVVDERIDAGEVASVLREVAGELAESVTLFDIYRGAPVPDRHKSLALHVVYRDETATLTDKRVDEAHARVVTAVQERFAAALRK